MLMQRILNYIYYIFLKNVSINLIRTEITKASIKDGWGDKEISSLPVYPFFKLYIDGKEEEASKGMTEYYFNIAIDKKAIYISKKDGGMKNGSTYQLIEDLHKKAGILLDEDLSNLNKEIAKEAIQNRVTNRFKMIDSLIKNGYSPSCQLIHATKSKDNDKYYLTDGHHRVLTMQILGYNTIPLAVNKPIIIKKIRRIFRMLHPKC